MNIKEIYENFSFKKIDTLYVEQIKNNKGNLSNTDKRFLEKIILKHKEHKKEDVLKAICLYTIWNPKESILYARKKGVFRYRIGNYKKNYAYYYLENLIKLKTVLSYSKGSEKYLQMKFMSRQKKKYIKKYKNITREELGRMFLVIK